MIGWRGLPFSSAPFPSVVKRFRAERDRLIESHALADDGRFADHDAGAVVDEEAFVDRCAGMDVYSGFRMGDLGDDARDHRAPSL